MMPLFQAITKENDEMGAALTCLFKHSSAFITTVYNSPLKMFQSSWQPNRVEGTWGWETERKGGGRCTGGGRREGGKWDSQGSKKREKKAKIMQHCAIFCNQKMQRWEPTNTGREPGLKGTGSGKFKPAVPPPPPEQRGNKESSVPVCKGSPM